MAQLSARAPAGVLELRDELRLHPVRALCDPRGRGKRRCSAAHPLQPLPHTPELRIDEARARVSDVLKAAVVVVDPKQQRAEEGPRPAGIGPAANHARLLAHYAACFLLPRAAVLRARARFRGRPACSRLSRSRSMRSTTSARRGSAWATSFGALPFILPLMIFIRFSRYSSVYRSGSHVSARFLTSVRAISTSGLRRSFAAGNE